MPASQFAKIVVLLFASFNVISIAEGIKCNFCSEDIFSSNNSFSCRGDPPDISPSDLNVTTCIASIIVQLTENGTFVIISTIKYGSNSFPFPKKGNGCFFVNNRFWGDDIELTAVCQCQDEDYCIEKFDVNSADLPKSDMQNISCLTHKNGNDSSGCTFGNVCMVDSNGAQGCIVGWPTYVFDVLDNRTEYPICTSNGFVDTCYCAEDNCNSLTLMNSHAKFPAPTTTCYSLQNANYKRNSAKCSGNYCFSNLERMCHNCLEFQVQQQCFNSTFLLTQSQGFVQVQKDITSSSKYLTSKTLCNGELCNTLEDVIVKSAMNIRLDGNIIVFIFAVLIVVTPILS